MASETDANVLRGTLAVTRLQLDIRGLPEHVVPALKRLAYEADVTMTELCRRALIAYTTPVESPVRPPWSGR